MKLEPPRTRLPLLHLLLLLSLAIPGNCLNRDGVLLLSFRYNIISDPLNLLAGWSFNDDTPCNWYGVTCSPADARVTALSLPSSQLRGSISPQLGDLDQLRTLNLSDNYFDGSLQTDFFRLSELRELDLSSNLLSGELPALIGQFENLELLNLSGNAFVGEFPSQLTGLGNLTVVSVRSNNFSGGIPTGMHRVRVLDLASNSFNGSLSDDFGGQSIHYLNISHNRISGEIPADIGKNIPENATIDFSYNNITGAIPDSNLFLNQQTASFSGNPGLCGDPLSNPCPIPSSPTSLPTNSFAPNSPPAIAAMPNNFNSNSQPAEGADVSPPSDDGRSGLKPATIAVIVAADLAGIAVLALVLFLVYRYRRNRASENNDREDANTTRTDRAWSSPSSLTSSETKGFTKWSCLGNHRGGGGGGGDADDQSSSSSSETNSEANLNVRNAAVPPKEGQNAAAVGTLVTVDGGERELEVETLLKASAFILGASGPSIVYKAVLEDGSALAVRRIGDGSADRLKDFESQIRAVAKVAAGHQNLVRIRGFYWAADEKLIIYEFVPNGSLANARYRKGGSSPCHLPWEYRLKIAKGVARGLSYLHEKKHVHGNLKPSNILLDLDMEPKIADFGLDKLAPGLESGRKPGFSTRHFGSKRSTCSRDSFQDLSSSVGPSPSPSASSIGCGGSPYHPPESLRSLKPNAKWDVYAFGVVLIELLTGKVMGPEDLATWMVGLNMGEEDVQLDKARVLRMADLAIRADLEGMEDALLTCLKLGCQCAAPMPQKRPPIKEALQVLEKLPASFSSPYF